MQSSAHRASDSTAMGYRRCKSLMNELLGDDIEVFSPKSGIAGIQKIRMKQRPWGGGTSAVCSKVNVFDFEAAAVLFDARSSGGVVRDSLYIDRARYCTALPGGDVDRERGGARCRDSHPGYRNRACAGRKGLHLHE